MKTLKIIHLNRYNVSLDLYMQGEFLRICAL